MHVVIRHMDTTGGCLAQRAHTKLEMVAAPDSLLHGEYMAEIVLQAAQAGL